MGFWGVGLYQNDIALDVKDYLEEQLRNGKDIDEMELFGLFVGIEDDFQEKVAFWFALADTQWDYGILSEQTKKQALQLIDSGADLEMWQSVPPVILLQRKRMMYDLRDKILQPQPPKSVPKRRRLYRCQWKMGDVFAYQMQSDLAKERGLDGRYLLIQKVDEDIWYPGHVVPIVYTKLTQGAQLPKTVEEFDNQEYIQISFSHYEERFWPLNGRRLQEDIEEKSKIIYETDEYGFLPIFRSTILSTSKKVIPSHLIYLGNFVGTKSPQKEFIPHSKSNLKAVAWKKSYQDFETTMVTCYCNHNLHELSVYKEGR